MSGNSISSIAPGYFKYLSSLQILLVMIDFNNFSILKQLSLLRNLARNQIDTLGGISFAGLPSLATLFEA